LGFRLSAAVAFRRKAALRQMKLTKRRVRGRNLAGWCVVQSGRSTFLFSFPTLKKTLRITTTDRMHSELARSAGAIGFCFRKMSPLDVSRAVCKPHAAVDLAEGLFVYVSLTTSEFLVINKLPFGFDCSPKPPIRC